jgi:hypothetical protein
MPQKNIDLAPLKAVSPPSPFLEETCLSLPA